MDVIKAVGKNANVSELTCVVLPCARTGEAKAALIPKQKTSSKKRTKKKMISYNLIAYHSVNKAVTTANVGKRKAFSIEDKVKFIRKLQNGESRSAICKEFSLSKSTVATVWKNRDSIIPAYEKNINGCKRLRKAEKENVEESLFQWFTVQRSRNLPITGALLQAKANEFAELFQEKSFAPMDGWIRLRSGKVVGEVSSVCSSDINHWMENVWPDIIRNHDEKDIFNANETGLFYKLTPNQTLKFKGEKCVGGQVSKARITILVCTNMNG
ncbi:Tigger transposable element-derived protein 4 [Araneus ventricosus]|uniref:Tigger transposable element-derived protein 4 n=1 Tax=Araneus ventricosus TaxID=182803 RepID=A0A4Y2LAK1_ARAVE|nr:Tigger transposable element-derived protein 4 [Araneus ventricosus]